MLGLIGLLGACGSSSAPVDLQLSTPAAAAAASTGPGATNTPSCAAPYGDPPRPVGVSFDGLLAVTNLCILVGGEMLDYTDGDGEPRKACAVIPKTATPQSPLPMVVWLHPSLFPIISIDLTGFLAETSSANLNGDPAHPGFILLLPAGRDTLHFYPVPDNVGLGWDNWYRDLDRSVSSPKLNVDVQTIDHFINAMTARGIVDTRRIYMSGWSNGAAMAMLYALNTPQIAAAAVYSAPDPYSDIDDPCAQSPFVSVETPIYEIHNSCDIYGICQTGQQFHQDLARLYPDLQQQLVIVDALKNPTPSQTCDALCAPDTVGETSLGIANHEVWPVTRNDDMFTFLREHPKPN